MAEPFAIGGELVAPGRQVRFELPVARLFTGGWLSLPIAVLHGREPGPRLFLDAAIHGDELNGMEIIRRVLPRLDARSLCGTIVAVPVVNVFGFVEQQRYLPDRRDLNRSFPGSTRGSLAARLANLFLQEVVCRCQYGIDLHTGSNHRANLPQVRADLQDPETRRFAESFGAPMHYQAASIHGSLRAAAKTRGVHILVYEAGQPMRFEEPVIRTGVDGVLRALAGLGMIAPPPDLPPPPPPFVARQTRWVRASRSGIFQCRVELGEIVRRHAPLGSLGDPWPSRDRLVRAPFGGMIIGHTKNPLAHQGDALVHLAREAPLRPNGRANGPSSATDGDG